MDSNKSQLQWFRVMPRYAAVIGGCFGALVLVGWALDIEILKRIAPAFAAMNPTSAFCFVLMGIALWGRAQQGDAKNSPSLRSLYKKVAFVSSAVVLMIAGIKSLEVLLGWNTGIDTILFHAKLDSPGNEFPNRMPPNTAFSFLFLVPALWLSEHKRFAPRVTSQVCTIVPALIGWLGVIGYVYGAASLYEFRSFIPMAFHSGVLFLVFAVGILTVQPECELMAIITDTGAGGQIARRVLPIVILVPSVFGWLRLLGEQRDLYEVETGVALMVVFSIAVSVAVILAAAASLKRVDAERTRAENETRQLNEELRQRAEQLQGLNRELEAFSYSVSHDLRAPVRHIAGFVNLLQKESATLPEKSQRYLGVIADSAQRMGQLIDDLLVFSRMGRSEMQEKVVDLNSLIDETIAGLQPELQGRQIKWKKNVLPSVRGDAHMLRQVFVNLLQNSVKYTRPKAEAEIEIGWKEMDKEYVIFVRDNGVGFDMQFADKLFGVFQRLHHSDQFEGTGIGLANVQRIIARHGGRVWAEAVLNEGATFYFSLPKQKVTT